MQYITSGSLFPETESVKKAIAALSKASSAEQRGAVFTRPEVVEFILDLAGYTADKPLHRLRILEPATGDGSFLVPVIRRLMQSWRRDKKAPAAETSLLGAIKAVELHEETFQHTRRKVIDSLLEEGLSSSQAKTLAKAWLQQGDFLLLGIDDTFHFIVGNPPYVRQELLPDALLRAYRSRYACFYDRADLYVPFIERSLLLLEEDGYLGFICPDRWMKNKYGGPLRKMIAGRFHLKYYVDMVDTPAFQSNVIAYPAIIVLTPTSTAGKQPTTHMAWRPEIDKKILRSLCDALRKEKTGAPEVKHCRAPKGDAPWLLEASEQLDLVKKLEGAFPLIETAGCKVGIGVATGADKVFIASFESLDVEEDRKLPLVMTKDIGNNDISWQGKGIINPFKEDGSLVSLSQYPKLRKYFEQYSDIIKARHVATRNPGHWYRTIDRIYPALQHTEKLLVPDIKGAAQIVYDEGNYYPHHNLYYIVSNTWDLKALQAVLRSGIAQLFVSAYSTKMRGGYLRFQAQYLRRIRLPYWSDIPAPLKKALIKAVEKNDTAACNDAVFKLYGLLQSEITILKELETSGHAY